MPTGTNLLWKFLFNGLHFQPTFVRWIYSVMEFNNQRQNKHLQYLPYNSYDVGLENLVLNQLIIHKLTFFSSTSLLCLLFIDLVGRKSALVKLRTMTLYYLILASYKREAVEPSILHWVLPELFWSRICSWRVGSCFLLAATPATPSGSSKTM